MIKALALRKRRPATEVEAFREHWRTRHAPIGARIAQIRRYVQSHPRPGGYAGGRQPAYDGAALTWFESTDAMRASARSEAYARVRADEANFLRPGVPPVVITREHPIIG